MLFEAPQPARDFTIDHTNEKIITLYHSNIGYSGFAVIDHNNPSDFTYHTVYYPFAYDILYNESNNVIIIGIKTTETLPKLLIFNGDTYAYQYSINIDLYDYFTDLILLNDPYRDKIYCVTTGPYTNDQEKGRIYEVDLENYICIETGVLGSMITGSEMNIVNEQLYYYDIQENPQGKFESCYRSIDGLNNLFFSEIFSSNEMAVNWSSHHDHEDIVPFVLHDENTVCFPNVDFSNISVLKAHTDTYTIHDGWTWLSFPRMERWAETNDAQHPIPVLSRIYEFPKDLYLEAEDYDLGEWIEHENLFWTGDLDELKSTEGYKLEIDLDDPFAKPNFEFHGGKLDPTYEISIHTGENWKGYFVEYPQEVEDCIPPEVMDDLTMIKAQSWTMVKVFGQWISTGKKRALKYGDMVILHSNANHTFSWVESENTGNTSAMSQPQNFSFTEQSDYVPMYVEIDEGSDIQEIAVLADGDVKGATVVSECETLVEVDAYLQGTDPDAEITFETWSPLKSTPVYNAYLVHNIEKNVKEKRTIFAGEKDLFHMVSLRQDEDYVLPDLLSDVSCHPNPVSDNTTISFRLEEDTFLNVQIMDLNGKVISTLYNGEAQKAFFQLEWNGKNSNGQGVDKGVYVYKISTTSGDIKTGRIVML